jgi:hypothetical protein
VDDGTRAPSLQGKILKRVKPICLVSTEDLNRESAAATARLSLMFSPRQTTVFAALITFAISSSRMGLLLGLGPVFDIS